MNHDNKKLVQAFCDRLWNEGDLSVMNNLLSHDLSFRGALGLTKKGHAEFIDYMKFVKSAFPDFHTTISEMVAENNKVMAHFIYRGTHRGELFGIPPSGKKVEYSSIVIFDIEDHKISRVFALGDMWGLMKQIATVTITGK